MTTTTPTIRARCWGKGKQRHHANTNKESHQHNPGEVQQPLNCTPWKNPTGPYGNTVSPKHQSRQHQH
eukprot:6600719-Heterocapsa_arctica.AAC.1